MTPMVILIIALSPIYCVFHPLTDIFGLHEDSAGDTEQNLLLAAVVSNLVLPPTFSPDESLTYYSAQSVNISSATEVSTIHYTLDGSDPSCSSTQYAEPLGVSANSVTRIRAIACVRDGDNLRFSLATEATYVAAPALIGSINTPVNAMDSVIVGDYAYVADWGGFDLQILSVSDPANPAPAAQANPFGNARALHLDGLRLFVALHGNGWVAYDISNPTAPSSIGSSDPPGFLYDLDTEGNLLYTASDSGGIHAIDISAIGSPTLLGTESSAGGLGLDAVGTLVYAARGASGLQVIDFSVPSSPSVIGTYASINASHVIVSGSTAYVADGSGGLLILNVSNPVSPTLLGAYTPGMNAYKLALDGSVIAVADHSFGLRLIDASNPSSPSLLGQYSLSGPTQAVTFSGNLVYVSDDDNGLFVFRYKR